MTLLHEVSVATIGAGDAASLPGAQLEMVVASVAEGNTRARLWAAVEPLGPRPAVLWDKGNNVLYLSGGPHPIGLRQEIADLIATRIRSESIGEGKTYFAARMLSAGGDAAGLAELFRDLWPLHERRKLFFALRQTAPEPAADLMVEGVRYEPIGGDLLQQKGLQNLEQVRAEIRCMWGTEERFRERGFGVAALVGDRIICWCTAEYVSRTMCGIGIQTVEGYEGKGVATAVTSRFVAECQRRHIRPHWECDARNIGSVRVAEKSGFERLGEATFWLGSFARRRG